MEESTFQLFESFDFEANEHFQAGWKAINMLLKSEKRASEYLRAKAFFFSRNVKKFDFQQYLEWKMSRKLEEKDDSVQETNIDTSKVFLVENSHLEGSSSTPTQGSEESVDQVSSLEIAIKHNGCDYSKERSACKDNSVTDLQSTLTKIKSEIENVETQSSHQMHDTSVCDSANTFHLRGGELESIEKNGTARSPQKLSGMVENSGCGDSSTEAGESPGSVSDKYSPNNRNEEENKLSLVELAELIQNNQPIPGVISVNVEPTNSNPTPSTLNRRLKPWESVEQEDCLSTLSALQGSENCDEAIS